MKWINRLRSPKRKAFIGISSFVGRPSSIGIIDERECKFYPVPLVKSRLHEKKEIIRVDSRVLLSILSPYKDMDCTVVLEKPDLRLDRLNLSMVVFMRAWEAVLVVLETLNIPYSVITPKEWQDKMLPIGIKGKEGLRSASKDIGCRLFPKTSDSDHPDRDGMLIAEYGRRAL